MRSLFRFLAVLNAVVLLGLRLLRRNHHGNGEGRGWSAFSGGICRGSEHQDQDHGQRALRQPGTLPHGKAAGRGVSAEIRAVGFSADPAPA